MPTTWNPSDKGINVILSNNNLTQQYSVDTNNGAGRSTTAKTTGKWYFEHTGNFNVTQPNGNFAVGIMTAAAALNATIGADSFGWGLNYNPTAAVFWQWVHVGTFTIGGTAVDGDMIGICVDLNSNFLYVTKNGANLAGDPVAGTGGQAIAAGTWFAGYGGRSLISTATGPVTTTNFGASNAFAFGPPSGFTAWDTSPFTYKSFDMPTVSITRISQPVGT